MSKDKEQAPQDDVAEQLRRLGAELTAVADDKLAREAKLKEVENFLGKLQVKDFPDLAESPVIQSFVQMLGGGDLKPGEVKNRGTLAEVQREWTMQDIQDRVKSGEFKLRRFTPTETMPLTFNGVEMWVIANGEEVELPDCFHDIYRNAMRSRVQAEIRKNYLMGLSDVQPDGQHFDPVGEQVRGLSKLGKGTLGYGRIIAEEGAASE